MIPLYACAGIACFAVVRIVIERYSLRKLPYLNVLSFAVAGTLVLLVPHPLAILAAAAYFVGSTLESNAIASTYAGGMRRDD
jgi:energy-converting hydrogenase A subunit C